VGESSPIGRLFSLGSFLKAIEVSKVEAPFIHEKKLCTNFDKKNSWATFWAMFSQTHLVTLTADLKQLAIWH
jgi:hypothetical protein